MDDATPVTVDYKAYENAFTGKIIKITIEVKEMKTADKKEEEKSRAIAAEKLALSK